MEEIIPRPIIKESPIFSIILYVSLAILMGLAISYPYLLNSKSKKEALLADLEHRLGQEKTAEEQKLEQEMLGYQQKIKDFAVLLDSHRSFQKFFKLLEDNCHPRVSFSGLSLNMTDKDGVGVNLSGRAENFESAEQQVIIFKSLKDIKQVNLAGLTANKEGGVDFTLDIILNPQLFSL